MRLKFTLLAGGLLLGLAACRGADPPLAEARVISMPVYGSSTESFSVSQTLQSIRIHIPVVDEHGVFIRLLPPDGRQLVLQDRTEHANLLFLDAYDGNATEIGALNLDASSPISLDLTYRLEATTQKRRTSLFEDPYRVDEIVVVPSGQDEIVSINWVEKNVGDYDFNGEVNAADLVPLSLHLGESGFRNSTAANTTAQYYIDGDENNEINIADIVPIARNYKNSISGYYIFRNNEVVMDPESSAPVFFARDPDGDGIVEPNEYIITTSPVFYQANVPGSFEDQYGVLPIDDSGDEQSQSVVFDGVELQSSLYFNSALGQSPGFFDLRGKGQVLDPAEYLNDSDALYCVMRIIDPIDIVNGLEDPGEWFDPANWEAVAATADSGKREGSHSYRFDKLKRPDLPGGTPRPYQLEFLVAPNVDLLTGEPRSYGGPTVPNSFYYRFAVPVYIPDGHRTMQADLTLDLVSQDDTAGYDVLIRSHQYQSGDEFDNSVTLLHMVPDPDSGDCIALVSRLDDPVPDQRYIASDFMNSPAFHDSNCDGISDQLQLQLITLADKKYYEREPFPIKLRGQPQDFDPLTGRFTLSGIVQILPDGKEAFYAGPRTIEMCELTKLHWIIHDENGDTPVSIDPAFMEGLGSNASAVIQLNIFDGGGLDKAGLKPLFWANDQTITLDLTNAN